MKVLLSLFVFLLVLPRQSIYAQEVLISNNVPESQKTKIVEDFTILKNIGQVNTDETFLNLLNTDTINGTVLMNWLSERIHFILTENDADLGNFYVIKRNVAYPNANIAPYSKQISTDEKSKNEQVENSNDEKNDEDKTNTAGVSYTMATNMAPAVYQYGKSVSKVYAINVKVGRETWQAPVTTPRAGIVAIGEGLFHPAYTINKKDDDAISDRIKRLATFFHEARHSDGNRESVGFAHASCPKGHDYEGMHACDENLNGPYTLGAQLIKNLTEEFAGKLSISEKEQLKIIQLDSMYRVLKITHKNELSKLWDEMPEEINLDD